MREAPKHMKCEEDDMFCKDFERLMGESLTDRLSDASKTPHLDIAIPMNLKGERFLLLLVLLFHISTSCIQITVHVSSLFPVESSKYRP